MKHLLLSLALLLVLPALVTTRAQISAPPDQASGANGSPVPLAGPHWTEVFPGTNPSARAYHAMVYDAAAGKVVMFAGYGPTGYLSGTFLWNGHNWTQEQPKTHPSPRYWHSMAYDGGAKNVVLFGGFDTNFNYLNDTWVWNGSNWKQ